LVKVGDVAYNKTRMWQGSVGYSQYRGIVSPAYIVVKPKLEINAKYFHYLFRTDYF
jgi:type I restriction enzyme S subunit